VAIIRNGEKQFVHPSILLVGDIMILESGVKIPADCLLIDGEDCQTTEAEMTGEIDNIKKQSLTECLEIERQLAPTVDMDQIKSQQPGAPAVDHKHDVPSPCLISGTQIVEGRGLAVVCAVGANSCEGRLKEIT
jgi:magnesium-transporting ATPase (P-type)